MDIKRQKERILSRAAALPGSRDVWGGPLLVLLPPASLSLSSSATASTVSVNGDGGGLGYSELVSLIGYLSSIPSPELITKGFTVLVDARAAPPKAVRYCLRACQQALYKKVRQVIVVQPEKFFEQQKINLELILEAFSFKTTCMSVHKLSKIVHITHLPEAFGGTFSYDARDWVAHRERFEEMKSELESGILRLRNEGGPLSEEHSILLRRGEALANEWATSALAGEQNMAAALQIRSLVGRTREILAEPGADAEAVAKAEKEAENERLVAEHTVGVTAVLDWLEGPGERWLLSLHEIGESRDEARQIAKEHSQLRMRAQELVKQSEELGELAARLSTAIPRHAVTLEKSRSHLRTLVTHFVSRVERGQQMAERSEHLHHLFSQFSRHADSLLEGVCTEARITELAAAQQHRASIESGVAQLQKAYEELADTGTVFIEDLAANEVNPLGPRPARDYSAAVAHIRHLLNAANERKRRSLDLVDVRLLKLQQLLQLLTCERDAEQSVDWLKEMHDTLLKEYNQVNFDLDEVSHLREDQGKLEETARSTYEYGKQLCQAALVLRRSLRMEAGSGLEEKLEQTCSHLCRALSESEAKLTATETFHARVEEVKQQLDSLERQVRSGGEKAKRSMRITGDGRRINSEIGRLRQLANLISSHINANHHVSVHTRQETMKRVRSLVDDVQEKERVIQSLFSQ